MTAEPLEEDWFTDPVKQKMTAAVAKMKDDERQTLLRLATPRLVEPYTKHIPHPAQQVFLSLQSREVMYGGAAGGGKSDALLMAALQYVDVPGYSALILRRTWPDLNAPGAILDRAKAWWADTPAKMRDGGRIWEFPTTRKDGTPGPPARIQFGYLLHDKDKYKFQSAEYQFIGFDELTQFEPGLYHYMFSRARRPSVSCLNCSTSIKQYTDKKTGGKYWKHTQAEGKKCKSVFPDPKVVHQYPPARDGRTVFDVPIRVRGATNPGGVGHLWVKERFIEPRTKEPAAFFVPAMLQDNPSLDQEEYKQSLEHLLPVDRERLLRGDWDVQEEGALFARHFFQSVDMAPARGDVVRFWDMAATLDGDYTVGCKVRHVEGQWYIEDIQRFRLKPHDVEKRILQTAMMDGQGCLIRMEQEPGSSGVNNIAHYQRNILVGYAFKGIRSTGDKLTRAYPVASAAQAGNVFMVKGAWNKDFLDEVALFPNGANDDQVDALSGAVGELAFAFRGRLIV